MRGNSEISYDVMLWYNVVPIVLLWFVEYSKSVWLKEKLVRRDYPTMTRFDLDRISLEIGEGNKQYAPWL